jgi:hypothetical protein
MIYVDRFKYSFHLTLAVALIAATAPYARSQAVAGAEVSGRVIDATGAVVPGAQVNMTQTDTSYTRTTTTDPQGNYSLPNLPVGPYLLNVTASGFKKYEQKGILLEVGTNIQLNATLEIGAVTESVEVSASAAMVETKENSVAQVINQRQIIDLPLNGRQATQLILVSGASTVAPNQNLISSKNYSSSTTMSVAGGQANGTNYLLDGGDNNDTFSNVNLPFPFPDALQEFSVETSSLPARNGLHPGGVVNLVTKSGTNQFHGDLFEFLRNGDVNARNFFSSAHDTLKRNQYGGTAGGKIIADKLFFFGGYQGTRNRQDPSSSTAYVPTPAALTGDFSGLESAGCQSNGKVRAITDPTTKLPYPNAQVPVSLFDPVALKIVAKLPVPNNPCGKVTYAIPSTGDEDQFIGKVDWNLSQKHSLFGRYFLADYRNPAISAASNALLSHTNGNLERAQTMTLGDTYSFSPTTINSFHATFNRLRNNRVVPDGYNAESLGVNMFNYDPSGMLLSVSSGFSTGASPGIFNRNAFQEADDVDLIRGAHQIAFGVDLVRAQNNLVSNFNRNGNFAFNGEYTNDPLLDFMEGRMSDFQQSRAQVNVYRETILGLYVQDSYKISSHLLINAGLRWEPMLYPQDYFGRGDIFSPQAFAANQHSQVYPNAPAGLLFYGDPGVPKAFTNDKFDVFSPRLGLVWNPHGNGKDTIRVGTAILHDTAESYYSERLTTNAPYGNSLDLSNPGPLSNPWATYPGGNPFPGTYPPSSNVTFPVGASYSTIPPHLKPTYMTQWNISYQRQLPDNWLVSVSYLGNKTTDLWLSVDLDPGVYSPGASTANLNLRRVLYLENPAQGQYYGPMIATDNGANATYNGLLTSVQHRFSHGFTFLANYTLSHCISDGDFSGNVGNEQYQNQASRRADRGDCNFDVRQIFNTSFVGISPGFGSRWLSRVVRDWQLAPLLRVTSGLPIYVATGKDNSETGINMDRPNLVSGVDPYNSTLGPQLQWLNSAAFTQNAQGTFGNLGRDVLRGPYQLNLDIALSRIFSMTERYRLEARAEAFNAINHTNFSLPKTSTVGVTDIDSITATTFGRFTSAGSARILQFAMKLHF